MTGYGQGCYPLTVYFAHRNAAIHMLNSMSGMKVTEQLHDLGQSLWLDNITRGLLNSGTLATYIKDLSITGLTSNPSIFDRAIRDTTFYDDAIRGRQEKPETLFFQLAVEDLSRAADLFLPTYNATNGTDGWVSLEVSPFLAYDPVRTLVAARELTDSAKRENLFIKIPGTWQGLKAIENAIFDGIPVNVTLLFSAEQYLQAARAYMRGIRRRIDSRLDPAVHSVASIFISRWDKAVTGREPEGFKDRLGIAVAAQAYRAYRELLDSPEWRVLAAEGAVPQRLLFASTGTKDPKASDTLYIGGLAAPDTVNTMPEATLRAFADHGKLAGGLTPDGGDCEAVLARFLHAGINPTRLADHLQREGADGFVDSWKDLMSCIESKSHDVSVGAGV
jgi:transaldolase